MCILLTLLCAAYVWIPKALAHSPVDLGTNESLETAGKIPSPSKSWAIYSQLHEGREAHYYQFEIDQGERIYISLFKPTAPEDSEFLPSLTLMGPNLTSQDSVPSYVEVPEGYGAIVVDGIQPSQANYEPFSPSSFYELAGIDTEAPSTGTYYIAVFEPNEGGHYGLAVGYLEEFTLNEWILIPLNLISIYQWERQSLPLILAPLAAILIIGLAFLIWKWKKQTDMRTVTAWTGALAGLLFLGTGLITLFQMALSLTYAPAIAEAAVTILLASIPIILGAIALRLSLKMQKINLRTRIYFAIIGLVALFMWGGLYVGPALAIICSLLPSRLSSGAPKL